MTLLSVEVGSLGDIGVTELLDGKVHRRVVVCGSIVDGEWVDADLSGELPEVQAAASAAWTAEVVAAYRAIVEAAYVPPTDLAPVSIDAVKTEASRRIASTGLGWMVEREVSGGAPIPQVVKDACALIRERSNAIETLDPIPHDFTDDKYWR